MKNYLYRWSIAIVALYSITFVSSCNKQLDTASTRQASEDQHWTKFEDARAGLLGMYGLFRAALSDNNAYWILGELRGGDFQAVSRPDLKAVIDGNLNASFPLITEATNWRRYYTIINASNLFIERVGECLVDPRYTESYYKLDIAQARAIRAFAYYMLVRTWGDVPLVTSTGEGNFENFPRTNQSAVLGFAKNELIEVATRLPYQYSTVDPDLVYPPNYYGKGADEWKNTLLGRLSAYAILAHIAALEGDYINAAVYSQFILDNAPKAQLTTVSTSELVSDLFLFSTSDVSWNQFVGFNFIYERGESTTSGHIEQLALANTTAFPMSKQLPDIYVNKDSIAVLFPRSNGNDQRFGFNPLNGLPTEAYFENFSSAIPVFKKIRQVDGGSGDGTFAKYNSSIVFTRLEEITLLNAEALAVLGRGEEAIQKLNTMRSNRGISGLNYSADLDLITEIFAERRRELLGEGWRWFDLVRYNKLKRNNPAFNDLIDKGGIYWPIAQDVINRNPGIQQNNYWK
ncbi:RagB/SusD family nutrient uptake outer membrane protein [Niabella ginsengisoli]|uniref:RagB/SusD family nutrient uptake outer membrane protein n=1 Tax=Niabella ginsengisoli TaxID=522298 RepID=A0ABS9SG09_9BACT|nr:RagB/SusD family nutrient uptake outer membrane protein [Niabella ginsengisoli]MCH5597284.1 RagB/SusD family nutrient uptake outer membrane protein [Niabella ginsengisoli]